MTEKFIGVTFSDKKKKIAWIFIKPIIKSYGFTPEVITATSKIDLNKYIGFILSGGSNLNPKLYGEKIYNTNNAQVEKKDDNKFDWDIFKKFHLVESLLHIIFAPLMILIKLIYFKDNNILDDDRDNFELKVIAHAISNNNPILGICRGMQILNVYFGGNLHQDIQPLCKNNINKKSIFPIKKINITPNTHIHTIFKSPNSYVNSLHKQAVKNLGNKLKVTAIDQNKIVSAIEYEGKQYILGVQWHPEYMFNIANQRKVFGDFLRHCTDINNEQPTFKKLDEPKVITGISQKPRKFGIEIEYTGISIDESSNILEEILDCKPKIDTKVSRKFTSKYGDFTLELDADPVKKIFKKSSPYKIFTKLLDIFKILALKSSKKIVPIEIISPPLIFEELSIIQKIISKLNENGALDTNQSILYAFGLQLNPEMPSLEPQVILAYIRSFMKHFNWFKEQQNKDLTRKMVGFVNSYPDAYIELVNNNKYKPDINELITDYITYNPSSNRALDMLPLFKFINKELVESKLTDNRIKARPTLHVRLPDSDINNKNAFANLWNNWIIIDNYAQNLLQESKN